MDRITAEILCKATDDFYTAQARSFSATRQYPWPGWERVLAEVGLVLASGATLEEGLFRNIAVPYTALDVGAGNLRFFRYLREQLPPEVQLDLYAVDNCEAMLPDEEALANEMPFVRFQKVDVLQRLLHGASLAEQIEAPLCSLVTCFGLMHHVPGMELRLDLLNVLVSLAAPGGYIAVSFWQFLNNPDLARKAIAFQPAALSALQVDPSGLDAGDCLLGWQDLPAAPGNVRYCHSFTTDEVDFMADAVSDRATVVSCFEADGRTQNLNRYVVLQAR